jgi:hypothetical protein
MQGRKSFFGRGIWDTMFYLALLASQTAFGTNVTTAQVFAGAVALIVLQLARVPAAIALIVTARCAP